MAELFGNFEINKKPRWPLMSRLLTASLIVHAFFLVALIYIPTLQSLLFVAGSFTGIEFVREDYDRTLIGQRATIIKLDPYQKLYYPSDYFSPAPSALDPSAAPVLVVQATPPPPPPVFIQRARPFRPRVARTRPVALPTPLPSPSPEVAQAVPSPSPSPAPDAALTAEGRAKIEQEIDEAAAQNGTPRLPSINPAPFEDLAKKGLNLKVDLTGPFDITASAQINENGTLNIDTLQVTGLPSDPVVSGLALDLINAISQSKVLRALQGAKQANMKLTLDEQKVTVRIESEVASEEVAAKMARGYAAMLWGARSLKQDTDEGELWKAVSVSSQSKQFVVTFEMTRDAAGKVIANKVSKMKTAGT